MKSVARIVHGIIGGFLLFASGAGLAQTPPENRAENLEVTQNPVVILNPAHESFVIPPFWVEGRAEPGEKLGVFVNGYRQFVIEADARGRFMARVAWTAEGPTWIEVRRGDARSHKVNVRVAEVSPPMLGRRLSGEKPVGSVPRSLPSGAADADDPVVSGHETLDEIASATLPDTTAGTVVSDSANPATFTKTQQVSVSLFAGILMQSVTFLWGQSVLLNDPGGVAAGLGVTGGFQASSAYLIQKMMGHDSSALMALIGVALPSLIGLVGVQLDSSAMVAAGFFAQPLGPTVGAAF